MTTFVLVHGAWHGGWCWRPVADRLRTAGHRVFAPTLTGLCDRAHLLDREVGLGTHVEDVVNLFEWEEIEDAVLCGHSYGGMVIAGVADRIAERIGALVYLDAFVPEAGGSLFDHIPDERAAMFRRSAEERGEGWKIPPPDASGWAEDAAMQAWLNAKVTPQPLAAMVEALPPTGARTEIARRVFVYANRNPAPTFAGFHRELRDDPAWIVHELETSHDAMLSLPDEVAALLADAAGPSE
jgi:pimeloyl-ACP methyl ester carboxylesterase